LVLLKRGEKPPNDTLRAWPEAAVPDPAAVLGGALLEKTRAPDDPRFEWLDEVKLNVELPNGRMPEDPCRACRTVGGIRKDNPPADPFEEGSPLTAEALPLALCRLLMDRPLPVPTEMPLP